MTEASVSSAIGKSARSGPAVGAEGALPVPQGVVVVAGAGPGGAAGAVSRA